MRYQRLFENQNFDKKQLKKEYLEFKKFVVSNRLTESKSKLNESLIPAGLKDKFVLIKNISKEIGVEIASLIKLFLNKGIFILFSKLKWSILNLYKIVKEGFDLYKLVFEKWAKFIRENKLTKDLINKTADRIKIIDEFFNEHPNLKKASGILVAGLLVYIWLNATMVAHKDIDFDISTIIDALLGKFDLTDLFLSDNGLIMLTNFIIGKVTGLTFPYPGSDLAKFTFAVIFTLAKKVKVKLDKSKEGLSENEIPEVDNDLELVDLSKTDSEQSELEYIDIELNDNEDSDNIPNLSLSESVKKKMVIRNGKKVIRYFTNNPLKKIKWVNNKVIEVPKKAKEIRNRKKAGIIRARKMKSKQRQITMKRNKSMKKRNW